MRGLPTLRNPYSTRHWTILTTVAGSYIAGQESPHDPLRKPLGPPLRVGWQFEKQWEAARGYALPQPTPLSLHISKCIPTLRMCSWSRPIGAPENRKQNCATLAFCTGNGNGDTTIAAASNIAWFGAKPETEMVAPLVQLYTWPETE